MAIFGHRDKDGNVNMLITGTVSYAPQLANNGKKVRFSMAYGKKKYMTVEAWEDSAAGRIAACLETGDAVLASGIWNSWEHEGRTYETLVADFIGTQAEFAVDESDSDNSPSDGTSPVEYTEIDDDDEVPF